MALVLSAVALEDGLPAGLEALNPDLIEVGDLPIHPPPRAEEMYHPETFGRGAGDLVVVEASASRPPASSLH